MAISKTQIKKIKKFNTFYILVPFSRKLEIFVEKYFNKNDKEYLSDLPNEYKLYILTQKEFDDIKPYINQDEYDTVFIPEKVYKNKQEIADAIERKEIRVMNQVKGLKEYNL